MELALKEKSLRVLTFVVTFIGMTLGLSLIPFFAQPVPLLIAFLVSFAAFMNHGRSGMSLGCLVVGLGLVYQMSRIDLISQISPVPLYRMLLIIIIPALFFILPLIFYRFEDAIAINLGIIAATLLLFTSFYYFAVPLILVVAVLYKKTKLGLTVTYYLLISLPLQIMQYLEHVLGLTNPGWWEDPAIAPFIYVPAEEVRVGMLESMFQFRILEVNKVFETISKQVTFAEYNSIQQAINGVCTRYADSLPGIILLMAIIIGLVAATAIFTRDFVSKRPKTYSKLMVSIITSAVATGLFFLIIIVLQVPLAFKVEVNIEQIIAGITLASLITGIATGVNYAPKAKIEIKKRSKLVLEKAHELKRVRLQVLDWSLNKVKNSIPLDVSSIERKNQTIKAKLDDIIKKVENNFYDLGELNQKFNEINTDIRNEIEKLMSDLDLSLLQYQRFTFGECSTWIQKFKEIGLEVRTSIKSDFQKDLALEIRLGLIRDIIEEGNTLLSDVIQATEQSYNVIRSLYDPALPETSLAVAFAKKQFAETEVPWGALKTLFVALHNWQKNYSYEISKTIKSLQKSLDSITGLSAQNEKLCPILEERSLEFVDLIRSAEETRKNISKKLANVLDILIIREILQKSFTIVRNIFLILYEKLVNNENTINGLLAITDYSWENKISTRKRLTSDMEIIINSSENELTQALEKLPNSLLYLDQIVELIIEYNERKEILLNYPIAKRIIEKLSEKKLSITAQDLPFTNKYAKEFLRLFYSENYMDFSFDQQKILLKKKA